MLLDLAQRAPDLLVIQTPQDTSTVLLAAQAHGVAPARIAKTLAFGLSDGRAVLVVAAGDVRVDNRKFKAAFGKGRMLQAEEVVALTGHPVGGVCPFGLPKTLPVFLDVSLREHEEVLPAGGSVNSAVRLSPLRLQELTDGVWVDVTSRA